MHWIRRFDRVLPFFFFSSRMAMFHLPTVLTYWYFHMNKHIIFSIHIPHEESSSNSSST